MSDAQSTDSQNSAPLVGSKVREDDVKTVSTDSTQSLASSNRASNGGGTKTAVTANVQAGK